MTAATSCASRVITGTCRLQGAPDSESSRDFTELGDTLAAPARSDSPSYKRGFVSLLTSAAADPYAHPKLWIKEKEEEEEKKKRKFCTTEKVTQQSVHTRSPPWSFSFSFHPSPIPPLSTLNSDPPTALLIRASPSPQFTPKASAAH